MAENTTFPSPSCWVVSEGHAGMENQAIGLAEAMGLDYEIKRLRPRRPWVWLPSGTWPMPLRALGSGSDEFSPPWPEIMITSGRRSVPYSLYAAGSSGGRIFRIHIQNPQCRLNRLDLIIAPEHDHLSGPNVIATLGALHRVTSDRIAASGAAFERRFAALPRPLVGVLIGGGSSAYRLDQRAMDGLLSELEAVAGRGHGLAITPSRRTGADNIGMLRTRLVPLGADIWDMRDPNPYFGILKHADYLIVTSDSTSMVSEAVSTGKPVYVYDLPGGNRKFNELHRELRRRGYTKILCGDLQSYTYAPLDETRRAADLTWQKFSRWRKSRRG